MPRTRKTPPRSPSDFIAYYRVSTQKQGESGLGLEAQRSAVQRYLAHVKGQLLEEFTEVESGKQHANRPELAAAIAAAKKRQATLIIAKLDRLARNVAFIANLMESASDFVACDMPQANRLTLHIMAALAEHERVMISNRTKAALEEAKKRGVQLGNPRWEAALEAAMQARRHRKPRPVAELLPMLQAQRDAGKSLREIAAAMNELGLKTPTGANWHPSSVRAALLAA
jgi:DNA invertase Pin-like site-specific DNA recombinase